MGLAVAKRACALLPPVSHCAYLSLPGLRKVGYIVIRGMLDRKRVLGARKVVTDALSAQWGCIDVSSDKPVTHACIKGSFGLSALTLALCLFVWGLLTTTRSDNMKGSLLTGFTPVTHHKDSTQLLGAYVCI